MKMKLDKTYIHSGKHFGPGDAVEVPDNAVEDLKARVEAAAAAVPALDSTSAGAQHEDDGVEASNTASGSEGKASEKTAASKSTSRKGK